MMQAVEGYYLLRPIEEVLFNSALLYSNTP